MAEQLSEKITYGASAESISQAKDLFAQKLEAVAAAEPKLYGFWEIIAAALPAIIQALTTVVSQCAGGGSVSQKKPTPEQLAARITANTYQTRAAIARAIKSEGCFCEDCNCGPSCNQATDLVIKTFRLMEPAERVDTIKLALDDASGKYDLI